LGGCMIGSVNRKQLRQDLEIPDQYDILLVIALGKPNLDKPEPKRADLC